MIEIKLYENNYFAVKKEGTWFKIEYIIKTQTWKDELSETTVLEKKEQNEINAVKKMYEKKFTYINWFIESYQSHFNDLTIVKKDISPNICRWTFKKRNEQFSVNISITKEKKVRHLLIGEPGGKINQCDLDYIKQTFPIFSEIETWFFTKSKYRVLFLF